MSIYYDYDHAVDNDHIKAGELYFGLEIESSVCIDEYDDEQIELLDGLVNIDDGSEERYPVSLVYDGSISGSEFVTKALTLEQVEEVLNDLYEAGLVNTREGYGLHIHLSRDAIGNESTFYKLACKGLDELVKLSGRTDRDLDNWCRVPSLEYSLKERYNWLMDNHEEGYRYLFFNDNNYCTVECRIFRGTNDPKKAFKRVLLLNALVEANKSPLMEGLTARDVTDPFAYRVLHEAGFYDIANELEYMEVL